MDERALRVLDVVRQKAGDGYTLMKRCGLTQDEFTKVIQKLQSEQLVTVEGGMGEIGDAYVYVPVHAKGRSDMLISSKRAY